MPFGTSLCPRNKVRRQVAVNALQAPPCTKPPPCHPFAKTDSHPVTRCIRGEIHVNADRLSGYRNINSYEDCSTSSLCSRPITASLQSHMCSLIYLLNSLGIIRKTRKRDREKSNRAPTPAKIEWQTYICKHWVGGGCKQDNKRSQGRSPT